jgi:hypothetical protein
VVPCKLAREVTYIKSQDILKAEKDGKPNDNYIAFAANLDGDLFVCEAEEDGAVYEWDDEGKGRMLAKSFLAYIEKYRNELLANKFEYLDEDSGLCEKSA